MKEVDDERATDDSKRNQCVAQVLGLGSPRASHADKTSTTGGFRNFKAASAVGPRVYELPKNSSFGRTTSH
jgi:hypothetical protein